MRKQLDLTKRLEANLLKEVRKPWGKELWIAQEKEYGGEILIIKGNHNTSQHFHKDKKETIYCFKGQVDIILSDRVVTLKEGEDITPIPRTAHRIVGRTNSVLFEVSTPQLADVVRLEEEWKHFGLLLQTYTRPTQSIQDSPRTI